MNRITLKSIPTIRLIENEYLADILFYFSKERGQAIVDNVTHLFNTSYHNFLEKHPDFAGKIAIIGYSLGGIITYDILSHQRQPSTVQEENEYQKVDVKYSKLDFTPDYFFGFGSPLAAMLTIRNQTPLLYHPHEDIIFENVFHPFDPLAYRFEPLLNDYYTEQPAVLVERSIPLGPSFSFPSIPSFPGAGILSFFSWKASSQQGMMSRSAESIVAQGRRTTESMVANQEERDGKKFISSFNSFLQYFSSPSSSAQRKIQQEESWDNKQPEPTNPSELKRPVMRSRSKTFGSPKELRQTIVKPQRHHLVEVLGIDGVRMESFEERAQQNFPRQNEDKSLWSDLNQELNEPGPAITSPGQSKEDVTKDATQPSGSGSNAGESMAKQAEDAKQQTKLPGGRRIDHVLQPESFMSMIANEYLVGLRAHFSYWTNKDLLWHIVCRLEDLEEVQRKDPQEQPK
ncbi:DDHD domain-containing protein [Fennellomyces sp. T-0311]|nr:DDHD domain-containing protein [Fennellomyces sp. T-0311]